MALAIKIGDTYNTGLLVNAPVVDIDITDYIGTYVLISNEHETDVEVAEGDERTFKLHKITIDRDKAEEFFTDFDSIPTFTSYPDWKPNLAICKEWDWNQFTETELDYYIPPFATKLYAGTDGIDQNEETVFFHSHPSPLLPPESYDNETEYEEDWSNFEAEDWKWKYCKLNFQQILEEVSVLYGKGCWYAFPSSFEYDAPSNPQESPYDYENPYGTNIYRLNSEWQMYRMIYPSENTRFGISHRWHAVDAGVGKYEINNVARLFCNPTGSAVNSMENFLPRVKDKDDNWVSLGANIYTEVYSPIDSPEVLNTSRYPEDGVPYLNKFFFVHYTYDGEEYYAIMVCNVYDIEDKGIYQIEGWGISENFYTLGVEPTPDPEEGQEEPGDGGVRPERVDQTAHDGLMGLNFDLGLSSRNPATRGLKLTYMPMSSLNAYIDAYIENKTGLLPDYDDLGDADKLLFAPSTEAIVQNCYDTFLDVYKLPVAPAGATGFTTFNIGGNEVSAEGAGGQYNFSQKREVDMGVLNLREIFGSYLDYAPNMKAFIWLPFCGMFEIPINSFMKGGLELKYIIDLLSGSCTAYLFGIDRTDHSTLVGSFGGDMKLPVPLATVAANTGIIGQALRNGLNSFASSQSQPFLTTRIGQQNIARGQQAYDFMSSGQAGSMGGVGTILGTGFGAIGEVETNIQNFGKGIAGGVAKGADFIASMREAEPVLSAVIGQVGGIGGWCGWTQPYVRIVAPVRSNPQDYTHFLGRPANVRKQIRDLETGTLNRANAPRITIPNATQQEKDAIYRILTTGFYK